MDEHCMRSKERRKKAWQGNQQWDPGSALYQELKAARQVLSKKRLEIIEVERTLSHARSSLYALNKSLQASKGMSTATMTRNRSSAEEAVKEDYIENVRFILYL